MNYCVSALHMQTIYIGVYNLNALFFHTFHWDTKSSSTSVQFLLMEVLFTHTHTHTDTLNIIYDSGPADFPLFIRDVGVKSMQVARLQPSRGENIGRVRAARGWKSGKL